MTKNILNMTNITKKKRIPTTKITTPTITDKKWTRTNFSDIQQEPNHFHAPHETEQEQSFVFEESEENSETYLFEDSEGDYDPEDEEDIYIEADDKYDEE